MTQWRISRFEWVVVASILGLAALVIVATEAQSERLAMTLAIRNIRTGLQLAMAQKVMHGEEDRMGELAESNPLDFIGEPHATERGVWGDWQFDARRHELVYRPSIAMAFEGDSELRWHIVGVAGPGGRVTGLKLVEVTPSQVGRGR